MKNPAMHECAREGKAEEKNNEILLKQKIEILI